MSLTQKTKDIVKHFGFKFNKSFGQNFLIDEDVLEKTIDAMDLTPESAVIEIGPGIGTLTHEIAKKAGKVYSIEIDETLIPILEETLGNYNNVSIIEGDALKVDFKKLIETMEESVKIKTETLK
jgi:16S rRNA (adenine1518-N6/adenine1519-N6)-dimethyltransferase